jgi:hypothetical protein
MIPCLCINAKDKPNDIPLSKWVEYNEQYRITYVCRVLPSNVLAYSIYEKPLDESCAPYLYFSAERFSVRDEDVQKVIDMYNELGDILPNDVLQELLENSKLVTR